MYATDIARILHIDEEEFLRIEPSVATVLKLDQDDEGRFMYSRENLASLRELFEKAVGSAPDEAEVLSQAPAVPKAIPVSESSKAYQWQKIEADEAPKSLRKKESASTDAPKRRIIPAVDVLKRITRDNQSALKHNREPREVTLEFEKIQTLLKEQKEFLEQKLEQRETEVVHRLEVQLQEARKECQSLKKRVDTLQKIIKNQNEDKKYLIEKINQKYSLWNLIQWRQQRQILGGDGAEDGAVNS